MLDDSGLLLVVHKDNFLLVSKGFGAPDSQQVRFLQTKIDSIFNYTIRNGEPPSDFDSYAGPRLNK